MGPVGFEPTTSRLSAGCSSQTKLWAPPSGKPPPFERFRVHPQRGAPARPSSGPRAKLGAGPADQVTWARHVCLRRTWSRHPSSRSRTDSGTTSEGSSGEVHGSLIPPDGVGPSRLRAGSSIDPATARPDRRPMPRATRVLGRDRVGGDWSSHRGPRFPARLANRLPTRAWTVMYPPSRIIQSAPSCPADQNTGSRVAPFEFVERWSSSGRERDPSHWTRARSFRSPVIGMRPRPTGTEVEWRMSTTQFTKHCSFARPDLRLTPCFPPDALEDHDQPATHWPGSGQEGPTRFGRAADASTGS